MQKPEVLVCMQIWVKPPQYLARDRLLGTYTVRPALARLRTTLLGLAGGSTSDRAGIDSGTIIVSLSQAIQPHSGHHVQRNAFATAMNEFWTTGHRSQEIHLTGCISIEISDFPLF